MKPFLFLVCTTLVPAQVAPPASEVFDPDTVHEIRLTFQQPDWYEQLTEIYDKYPDNTPYIEASIEWGSNRFDKIGVRFRGNSSYRGATTKKKPFRIKLNEFVKGQKIEGMASFGLSNGWNDPSMVREKAYYELAAGIGLAAPRSSFAALYVNGEYWGLYVLGEIVNGDFLKNHFAKGEDTGNLYKATEPGANLAYLGEDPASYQRTFSKESNEDANDWTDLIELARIFEQTPSAELPAKIRDLVDVDSFLTALALDNLTVNLDSYVGMAQNYYLYRRPSDKKWVWIVWDPSLAFGALAQGVTQQQMRDLSLEWVQAANAGPGGGALPGVGQAAGRPIATKLWGSEEYKKRYREIYARLLNEVFVPAHITERMTALRDMIRPFVEQDTQKLSTMAQFEAAMSAGSVVGAFGLGSAPALAPFVEARILSVQAQLAGLPSPVVTANPTSIEAALLVNASSSTQNISLTLPQGVTDITYSAATTQPWITLSGATGGFPGRLGVTLNAAGLQAGSRSGMITIAAPGTTSNPVSVPVTLAVAASPSLIASPASIGVFSFGGLPGGGAFPGGGQTIRLLSTAGTSPFTISISDSTCGNFVSANPTLGNTPATITVSAAGGVTGTNCTAKLNFTSPDLATATVTVTLAAPVPGMGFPGGPR